MWETNDGALIYLQTKGFRYGPADVMAEVGKGNPVDPTKYTFRMTMNFETTDPRYTWLNRVIGVGSAMRLGAAVVYNAYLLQ